MRAIDIMTHNPRCCLASQSLTEVARMMLEENVGEVPVVDQQNRLIGIITDRDIVTRFVAEGGQPDVARVETYMTAPAHWLHEDATLEQIASLMMNQAIRRVPITGEDNRLCGVISLADLERTDARSLKAEVSHHVAKPH
jgi:CBS domain-containing protein